ncbi:hypothetical protein [Metabacillus bambusae]|uniref:Uncharacterized protein n=1 Tax=Metabacillus bambusae TaxID=2795218 RepID=A0ABS3N0I6_9BACI|nr:hypothetical protein [Metabacillus bambusae]MBO1511739.1 hypothetical protein [Metabacillus bambusae]
MYVIPLELIFKGERNYVQSADIYNEIANHLEFKFGNREVLNFRMDLHRFVATQCNLIINNTKSTINKTSEYFGEIHFTTKEGTITGWLLEGKSPIKMRNSYNEDIIQKHSEYTEKKVSLKENLGYRPMEIIVSLTKHLHNYLYPNLNGKWIFTKIELKRLLISGDIDIDIELQHNFQNRLTKSVIKIGREQIGYIYFSHLSGGN